MRSIGMQYRQFLLVGQLSLEGSSESTAQGIITSGYVLSKTAIFPKKKGGGGTLPHDQKTKQCAAHTLQQVLCQSARFFSSGCQVAGKLFTQFPTPFSQSDADTWQQISSSSFTRLSTGRTNL